MLFFYRPKLFGAVGIALSKTIEGEFLGPGEKTKKFERDLFDLVGVPAVATVNGSVALMVAAHALDSRNANIIVPAYGIVAVPNAFNASGMCVRAVDIDRRTGCMSKDALYAAIKEGKPHAICYVDFSGTVGEDANDIRDMCDREGIWIIEDAACALLNPNALSIGHIATTSFSPHKLITTGQGGAVFSKNSYLFDRCCNYIWDGDYARVGKVSQTGINLRLSDINSTIGIVQLEHVSDILYEKRKQHSLFYQEAIPLYGEAVATLHNIIFAKEGKREVVLQKLKRECIDARIQYNVINNHPLYKHIVGNFENAQWWHNNAIYLPFGIGQNVTQIIDVLKGVRDELVG